MWEVREVSTMFCAESANSCSYNTVHTWHCRSLLHHLCECWEGSTVSREHHRLCAERELCLDTEAFSALKAILEKRSLVRVYSYTRLVAVLFSEAVWVMGEFLQELGSRRPCWTDRWGCLLSCCCQGLLLRCTSTWASLSGEPVATVTDISFFIIDLPGVNFCLLRYPVLLHPLVGALQHLEAGSCNWCSIWENCRVRLACNGTGTVSITGNS